jgi:hypothetical protein
MSLINYLLPCRSSSSGHGHGHGLGSVMYYYTILYHTVLLLLLLLYCSILYRCHYNCWRNRRKRKCGGMMFLSKNNLCTKFYGNNSWVQKSLEGITQI